MKKFIPKIVFALIVLTVVQLPSSEAKVPPKQGFFCPAISHQKLVAVDPASRLKGFIEIDECFGNSFLRIYVSGSKSQPSLLPVIRRGLEPVIGPELVFSHAKSQALWIGVTSFGAQSGGLSGLILALVTASDFQEVMNVTFK